MTGFVVAAALMVAIGLAWLLPPLLRGGSRGAIDRAAVNLGILRDQLAELDAEHARGAIADGPYAASRAELQQRVLEETQAEAIKPTPLRHGRITALAVALVVPVVAGLLYVRFGDPTAFNPLAVQGPDDAHKFGAGDVERMVEQLVARLEREPDNAGGWSTLARTYYTTGRYPQAAAAFEKLVALVPDDASLLADYADALAMAQGRRIDGKPLELIRKALKLDPTQWKALAMAGTEAFERKDYRAAVALWEKLRDSLPADAPIAQQIAGSIAEARQLAGMAPARAAAPLPSTARVGGTVALSPKLAAQAKPEDTVFIFARPAQGSRMPLALLRVQVKDLPKQFSLDDSQAMSPEFALSKFGEVVVGARVSKSGSAAPAAGDFEGASAPVKLGRTDLAITIDSVVR